MAIVYDNVIPWGRSFDEYVRMFHLTEVDLAGRVLGCGERLDGRARSVGVSRVDYEFQRGGDELLTVRF